MRSGEKALTIAQVHKLLGVVTDLRHKALLELAIAGGIRRADIVKIMVRDVNPKENAVTYYEHKKKRIRTVYIQGSVMNTLIMCIRSQKGTPYLFPSSYTPKKPISSKTAYNILQKHLKNAGLPSIPFHALRATCYKIAKVRGWSVEQAAKHIGDTVRVAQEHYGRPSDLELKEVSEEKALI